MWTTANSSFCWAIPVPANPRCSSYILREELPTSGKVTVLGKDVAHLRRRKVPYLRRQMGIIFQDFRLILP